MLRRSKPKPKIKPKNTGTQKSRRPHFKTHALHSEAKPRKPEAHLPKPGSLKILVFEVCNTPPPTKGRPLKCLFRLQNPVIYGEFQEPRCRFLAELRLACILTEFDSRSLTRPGKISDSALVEKLLD